MFGQRSLYRLSSLAVAGALLGSLAACDTLEVALMPASSETAVASEPSPPENAHTVVEKTALAPVALASGLALASRPRPEAAANQTGPAAMAPPAVKPALEVATAAPEPMVAGVPVTPPPINCPAGTLGMWSQPDIVGSAVYICRALHPPR